MAAVAYTGASNTFTGQYGTAWTIATLYGAGGAGGGVTGNPAAGGGGAGGQLVVSTITTIGGTNYTVAVAQTATEQTPMLTSTAYWSPSR